MSMPELLRNGFRCHACGRFSEDSRVCVRCGSVICPECDHGEIPVCASCQENDRRVALRIAQALRDQNR